MTSHHHEQLASALERSLREVFARGFQDPRIAGILTITTVELSQDHATARVGVSVLPAEKADLTLHGLRAAAQHIRREAGELIRTRSMPTLVFFQDSSLKKQAKVLEALDRARSLNNDAPRPKWGSSENAGEHSGGAEPPETAAEGDRS